MYALWGLQGKDLRAPSTASATSTSATIAAPFPPAAVDTSGISTWDPNDRGTLSLDPAFDPFSQQAQVFLSTVCSKVGGPASAPILLVLRFAL